MVSRRLNRFRVLGNSLYPNRDATAAERSPGGVIYYWNYLINRNEFGGFSHSRNLNFFQ